MANHTDNRAISFDVNETLFFETGQGISEMVSISLEPDILVQSYGDYIQIRGLIILQGEYRQAEFLTGEKPNVSGTIERIIETENGHALFSHRFPVDITVSAYRVENLDEVSVSVDSFDYEIPDRNTLKVTSSIIIYGIDVKEATVKANEALNTDEPIAPVSKPIEEAIVNEAEENIQATVKANDVQIDGQAEEHEEEKAIIEESGQETEEVVDQDLVEEEVFLTTDVQEESENEEEEEEEANEENSHDEKLEKKKANEIDIQLNESEQPEEDKLKDVQLLRELFGDTEEEETHTKIRLYIAQDDDTVASIAKHYEISTLQLLKDNHLTSEHLIEGQILKIPVQTKK